MPKPQMPEPMRYMTVVPGRKPVQKMHKSLGHAKNALLARHGGAPRYEVDGRTVTYAEFAKARYTDKNPSAASFYHFTQDMELWEFPTPWSTDPVLLYAVKKGQEAAPWK